LLVALSHNARLLFILNSKFTYAFSSLPFSLPLFCSFCLHDLIIFLSPSFSYTLFIISLFHTFLPASYGLLSYSFVSCVLHFLPDCFSPAAPRKQEELFLVSYNNPISGSNVLRRSWFSKFPSILRLVSLIFCFRSACLRQDTHTHTYH